MRAGYPRPGVGSRVAGREPSRVDGARNYPRNVINDLPPIETPNLRCTCCAHIICEVCKWYDQTISTALLMPGGTGDE